jgi:hypothetical protein
MATKQKEQLAREAIANFKLRAAIQSTNYEVTGEGNFFKSSDWQEKEKNQREWDSLRAEEAAEQKQEQLNSPYMKTLRAQWRKPLATIMHEKTYAMGLFLDPTAELPTASNPADADFSKAEHIINHDLDDVLESRGVILSRQGKFRTLIYGGLQSDAVTVVNGVEQRGAVGTLQYWIACVNRLAGLDAYDKSEYAALPEEERQPEPDLTAEALREAADSQWLRIFGQTYRQWLASLAQAPWNFTPDEDQQRAALKYLEARGTGDNFAFDNCRVAMSDAGIFPALYTSDDLICKKLDAGEWDLSTPAGRTAYQRAKNQVHFRTI